MALDRLQSKPGMFVISAEPGYTVAQSLSSIVSNQIPGGYQFGREFAIAPAATGTVGGGAFVHKIIANQTYAASSGTGAMISHDGCGVVLASISNGGLHNLQPPSYNGQALTIVNVGTATASIVTGAVLAGQGTGSTTTAVIPTLASAQTIGGAIGTRNILGFYGLSTFGGTASNSTYAIWMCAQGATSTSAVAGGSAGELVYKTPVYSQTYAASSGTGAMISHNGAPIVYAVLSAAGLHNLQPPTYDGQVLTVQNIANVSGSFVTGAVLSGQGAGSTTTVVIPTLTNAVTFGSSGGASAVRCFVGLSTFGSTATNSTYAVWSCSGIGL